MTGHDDEAVAPRHLRLVHGGGATAGYRMHPSFAHPSEGLRRRLVLYVGRDPGRQEDFVRAARRLPAVKLLVARCGRDALRLAADRRFRIILTEPHLGDLDAEELTLAIRQRGHSPSVPIVVMAGDHSSRERARFIWAGADTCLPDRPEDHGLDHTIGMLLENAAAR